MESSCTNVTEAVRLVQLLKIQGFSATKGSASPNYIPSRWLVDGYECEVCICPAYKRSTRIGDVWVILKFTCHSTPRVSSVVASLACRLVDPTGELQPSQEKSVSGRFLSDQRFIDDLYLVRRDDLPASGYLKDDTLTIQCAIAVLKDLPLVPPRIPAEEVPVPPSNLYQHLDEILQSEMGADVTFLVSGESFAAHKNILAARSPVFKAQFFGEMKEKCSQRVEIEDMEAAVFKTLLHFIYTDTVPELEKQQEASMVMAQHLLAAADRYGVDRLKVICEAKLSRGITVDTAATTLALAQQHNCSRLWAKCVQFIVSTPAVFDAVLATEGYRHLAASCPSVLADLIKSSLRMGGKN